MSDRSAAVKAWRKRTRERIIRALGCKCVCCGYQRCAQAMDCHHLSPDEKEYTVAQLLSNIRSWAIIVAELKKCVLVCKCCHTEIHVGLAEIPANAARFDIHYEDYHEQMATNACPVCGKQKAIHLIVCSRSCAAKRSRKVDWSNIDLLSLLKQYGTYAAVGAILGVSGAAVSKRFRKLKFQRTRIGSRDRPVKPTAEMPL